MPLLVSSVSVTAQIFKFLQDSADWLWPALGLLGSAIAGIYQIFSAYRAGKDREIRALQEKLESESSAERDRLLGQISMFQAALLTEQEENNLLVHKLEERDEKIRHLARKLRKSQGYVEDLQLLLHQLHRNHEGEGITEVLRRTSDLNSD